VQKESGVLDKLKALKGFEDEVDVEERDLVQWNFQYKKITPWNLQCEAHKSRKDVLNVLQNAG